MRYAVAIIIFAIVCATNLAQAEIAPEFGTSIAYDKGDPAFRIGDLRGKVTLVLFFQSWCPICNGWSPKLISQLESTYAKEHALTLVAIKTDGDASGAKQYLKEHGGNPDLWLVASDADAAYVKNVMGADELWQYAVLDPDGKIADRGKAGRFRGNNEFVLASERLDQKYGGSSGKLLSGEYPESLDRAVTLAEAGCLAEAIVAAASAGPAPKAKQFRDEILAVVGKKAEACASVLGAGQSAAGDECAMVERLKAYHALGSIAQKFKGAEPGKNAEKAINEAKKDKAFKQELAADSAWQQVRDNLAKIPADQRKAQLSGGLSKFIKAHAGTVAAASAQELLDAAK